MRKNRFTTGEVIALTICSFIFGASIMALGSKRRSKGGIA